MRKYDHANETPLFNQSQIRFREYVPRTCCAYNLAQQGRQLDNVECFCKITSQGQFQISTVACAHQTILLEWTSGGKSWYTYRHSASKSRVPLWQQERP